MVPPPSPGAAPAAARVPWAAAPQQWSVVLPVKGGPAAKSRLGGDAARRRGLALAMALDCLEAVLAAPGVRRALVVTQDPEVTGLAAAAGARVLLPGPAGSRPPLDAAVADGARGCEECGGHDGVAVLLADVPALRPGELASALSAVGSALADGARSALVPDAGGTGTALLAARRARDLRTAYGEGSAARHEALGARRLELDLPGLRRDVDTPADLVTAQALGLGRRTRAVLDGPADALAAVG
ncbi:2-phospho-L-lactate guanylyltransferase [Pseudokineococcus basanitobsidens]|uniref:Phosphoenolpyruvate guanylyltransferase n=1 Tax=Pseudokineococcus basanitobsidens TaxID=1926649 RepID=A0ABU8RJX4_9ACTN